MLSPNPALGVVGGDQDAGVVNHWSHRDQRFRRGVFCSTRARAAASSAGVSAPCSLILCCCAVAQRGLYTAISLGFERRLVA